MAKRVFLENRSEPSRYNLFGISCHFRDYMLSYHMNIALHLDLVKMDDFQGFSYYSCHDEDHFNVFHLLGNRGQEAILLPDLKQTDFLLLLEGPLKKVRKDKILGKIKGIQSVLTAFEVRPETVRNFNQVLIDLELHQISIQKELKTKYSPIKK
jgi:hypothetical protein